MDLLRVQEDGRELTFSFEAMLSYHGGGSPGGVAHAFKVLELSLPRLGAGGLAERREIQIETAFRGPGARDAFELVTRAVTDDRMKIDPTLERPELGLARERFVFRFRYGACAVLLTLRDGFVSDEFIELTRRPDRTHDQDLRLMEMKAAMARHVMSAGAADVYELTPDG